MRAFVIFIAASLMTLTISGCTSTGPTTMPTTQTTKTLNVGASCKLSPEQRAARRHELIPGLFQRAEKVEDIPKGLRFRFASKPGLLTDLARIMDQEQDCCSFLRIQLTMEPSEGPVTFEVTGPDGTGDMLRKL